MRLATCLRWRRPPKRFFSEKQPGAHYPRSGSRLLSDDFCWEQRVSPENLALRIAEDDEANGPLDASPNADISYHSRSRFDGAEGRQSRCVTGQDLLWRHALTALGLQPWPTSSLARSS